MSKGEELEAELKSQECRVDLLVLAVVEMTNQRIASGANGSGAKVRVNQLYSVHINREREESERERQGQSYVVMLSSDDLYDMGPLGV